MAHYILEEVFYPDLKNKFLSGCYIIMGWMHILKELVFGHYDIIHVQTFKVDTVEMFLYKHFAKQRLVHTAHNILPHEVSDKDKKKYEDFYKVCSKIIVHNEYSKALLKKGYRITDCITVMPHGIYNSQRILVNTKFEKTQENNLDIRAVNYVEEMPEIVQIETNAFVGPLVKMNVVEAIGVPDGSLFIYGDDTEYMYRISRKYKVYLVKSAVINHRDVIQKENTVNPKGFWKEYYKYRNRLLFVDEFKTSCGSGIIGKTLIIKDCLRDVFSTLKNKKYKGYRKLRIKCLNKAIKDGYKGEKGKTVDPKLFVENIKTIQ